MSRKLRYVSLVFVLFFLLSSLVFFSFYSTAESSEFEISSEVLDQKPRLFGNATEDGIELKWSFDAEDEEVKKFRIFRSLSSSFKELYDEIEKSTSEYLDEDIEEGRTYSYRLAAWFGEGKESRLSEEVRIKAEGENKPLPPRNLKTFPGDSKVALRWDPPLDPDVTEIYHYNLYREKDGEELPTETPGNSAQKWVDLELENGEEYTYRLRAENNVGESEAVKVTATPTDDLHPPNKPTNFNAFISENGVELTWEPPENDENILDYGLYRDGKKINEVGRDTYYFVDEGVKIGEVYNYSISSMNVDDEESKISYNRTVRVEEGRYLFSIEEDIENITDDLDNETICERYREIYEDEGFTLSVNEDISITVEKESEEWELHDEIRGYKHKIRKENDKLTICEGRKSSPKNLELEPGDGKIKISWDAPAEDEDDDIKYNIYRGENEGDMTFLTQVEGGSRFTDEKVENGRVYHYKVRAVGPENVLGNATATRHSVPIEEAEGSFSSNSLIGFAVMIAIGIAAIVLIMRRREPEGPNPEKKEKK